MDRQRQKELEQAYLPEWQPSGLDAISILEECALQMLNDSYERINCLMVYQRTCFYRTLSLPALDEKPFTCRLCFTPSPLYDGTLLKKGTRLYIQKEQLLEMSLQEDIAVQHAQVDEIIGYDPIQEHIFMYDHTQPMPLFHENLENAQCFSFSFSFQDCFENLINPVFNLFFVGRNGEETKEIVSFFDSEKVVWQASVNGCPIIIANKKIMDDHLQIQLSYAFGLESHCVEFHIAVKQPRRAPYIIMKHVYLTIPEQRSFLTQVMQNEVEQTADKVPLFDHPLTLFQMTYVRASEVFARKGSRIEWKFQMDEQTYPIMEELIEKKEYRLFMRKLPKEQIVYDVYADRIQFEYFNGEWISLRESALYSTFAKSNIQEMKIKFTCPLDMQPYTVNGIYDYWLRLVLVKAENCYQIPAKHHIPILQHHRFLSHCDDSKIFPVTMNAASNGEIMELMKEVKAGKLIHLFKKRKEKTPCLFLLLKKRPAAPFRMYCKLHYHYDEEVNMQAYTYVNDEEVPLLMEDETHGFMNSGQISFFFPDIITKHTEFQKKGYYVKLVFPKWKHKQQLDMLVFHSGTVVYQAKEYRTLMLPFSQFPLEIPIEENLMGLEVLEQHENKQVWTPWNIRSHLSKQQRMAQVTSQALRFSYESMQGVNVVKDRENVRMSIRKILPLQKISIDESIFLAEQCPQISSITSYGEQWIGMEAETKEHLFKRYQHVFLNHGKGCSLWDMKQYLQDMYPDIYKINGVYGQNQYHEACERMLCFAIVWKQQTHYEQEILEILRQQMAFDAYDIRLRICDALMIHVDAYVQLASGSPVAIETYIKAYFHQDYGYHGNGWQIGQIIKQEEVLLDLQQEFADMQILTLQLYGSTIIREKRIYSPLSAFHDYACGLLCQGKVEIEVCSHV